MSHRRLTFEGKLACLMAGLYFGGGAIIASVLLADETGHGLILAMVGLVILGVAAILTFGSTPRDHLTDSSPVTMAGTLLSSLRDRSNQPAPRAEPKPKTPSAKGGIGENAMVVIVVAALYLAGLTFVIMTL